MLAAGSHLPPLLAACCAGKAGVSFSGPASVGYRANLWLRAAIRVLQLQHETLLDARRPAGEAVYDSFREAADWARLLQPGQSFSVDGRVWSCSNLSSSQVGGCLLGMVVLGGLHIGLNGARGSQFAAAGMAEHDVPNAPLCHVLLAFQTLEPEQPL